MIPLQYLKQGDESIKAAAALLRGGGLVAFPTETVYGLGAVFNNPQAVARIFKAKGRPQNNPLIVHIALWSHLPLLVREWTAGAEILAQKFWPGPLTIITPRSSAVSDAVTGGCKVSGLTP